MEEQKLWNLDELCKLFRVCDKTIKKWVKLGRLKRVPDCRKIRVTDESVRALAGINAG